MFLSISSICSKKNNYARGLSYSFLCLIILGLGGCASPQLKLHLYSWGNFFDPQVLKAFEEKYACRIVIDYYDSNEVLYAKLKAGAEGYDLVFPSNYILKLLNDQHFFQNLDKTLLPNLKYLDPSFNHLVSEDLKEVCVPYAITFSGIGYRKDRISQLPKTWGIFGNKTWKGRMTMFSDMREVIGAALKYLGYSVNTIDEKEIDLATDIVISWKKNLAKFDSEQYKNGLASAEYLIVQGYSGDILQLSQEDALVDFVYPKQGAIGSSDYLAIPSRASHVELAHAFINFMYDPEIAAKNIEHTFFLLPNLEAYKKLKEPLRTNSILFPSIEDLEKAEFIQDVGNEIGKYYKAWDRIKNT